MNAFERSLAITLQHEGFFSNDPDDRGGATTYGITEKVARAYGYNDPMIDFPVETAKEIYRYYYWDKNRLDDIAEYYEPIAAEMFDTGVNMGCGVAGEFLQRAINCLGGDLKVDCIVGTKTIKSLLKLPKLGEKHSILKMLKSLQGSMYIEICERKPTQKKFITSWLKRV